MSSAYGTVKANLVKLPDFLPLSYSLSNAEKVVIEPLGTESDARVLHETLNDIIKEGKTYPHEDQLDFEGFKAYFTTGFVCKTLDGVVLGGFYVKPNFPGRCSHICNGGFIVNADHRGKGVGRVMGSAYLKIAPAMGFKASIFNLVFEDNVASVKLWKSLGFQITGRVPKAGRLNGKADLVDALVFHYSFE